MFFQSLTRRREIGANAYWLRFGGTSLVLDAGMHPNEEGNDALPDFDRIEENTLDGIVVSHSHLDHIGGLPVLMRKQPRAPVYMTEATGAVGDALLHNSVNVMTSKREELGIDVYPFFTHREIDMLQRTWEYRTREKPFAINGVECCFYDAGHVMGSVGISLAYGGRKVFYTGDVNFEDQTIACAARFPREQVDTLIIETTRCAVERPAAYTREREKQELGSIIQRAFERGGAVMIPVFAMGKTQEVLVMLHELKQEGTLPPCPVFIGGLSTKMTTIVDRFAERVPRQHRNLRILRDIELIVSSRKRRKDLQYSPGCIYAISSGMMTEKTLSNQFAFQFIDNPRNALVFVGYAAPDSPAGRIRAARPGESVTLDPKCAPVELHCDVEVLDFSAHAVREDLREFVNELAPSKVLLVHGDDGAMRWLQARLEEDLPASKIILPEPAEEIALG